MGVYTIGFSTAIFPLFPSLSFLFSFFFFTVHVYLLWFVLWCLGVFCSVFVHIFFLFFSCLFPSYFFLPFSRICLFFTGLCAGHRTIYASFTLRRFLHTEDMKITGTWTLNIKLHLMYILCNMCTIFTVCLLMFVHLVKVGVLATSL